MRRNGTYSLQQHPGLLRFSVFACKHGTLLARCINLQAIRVDISTSNIDPSSISLRHFVPQLLLPFDLDEPLALSLPRAKYQHRVRCNVDQARTHRIDMNRGEVHLRKRELKQELEPVIPEQPWIKFGTGERPLCHRRSAKIPSNKVCYSVGLGMGIMQLHEVRTR